MTDKELMQQALDALDLLSRVPKAKRDYADRAIAALRDRLAQPEQRPVPPPWWPAVENILNEYGLQAIDFVDDFKKALAQPEQEPVALETVYETIIQWDEGGGKRSRRELARRIVALYTTLPQRKPLTEKRIEELYSFWVVDCQDIVGFARAVERTVKGEA